MKRLLFMALIALTYFLAHANPPIIRPPVTFAGTQAEQFGFIEVSSSFLLCGSFEIVPQKNKENTPIYLRATRSNRQMKSPAVFKKEFEPIWQSQKPALLKSTIQTGPATTNDQTLYNLALSKFIKDQIGDYFTQVDPIRLPKHGMKLKYDGGPAFRIYVYTSPLLTENPVNPQEYVIVKPIKDNAPCVGVLAPAESYEPLNLKNKLR